VVGAGFLVGVGTRYGAGCTSGHGVCGLARLSPRSAVATLCFMSAGFATVFLLRHVLAGA
ncbi:YeeE/YedE family protein, partial [Pseudomonas soli]|uniref:YeeE/YedE family protein n=1 Tax=Pseudomonas soli TaxID=1306993 RepID=UPI0029B93212|nr:YeeE/YedE family protein [Pseudomonas soli]